VSEPRVTYTLHRVEQPASEVEEGLPPLWAILPDDGTRGLLIGQEDIAAIHELLGRWLATGEHDGEIDSMDPGLGWQWLTVAEAQQLALDERGVSISDRAIRAACADGRIRKARRAGRDWLMAAPRFRHWLTTRNKES
jgi:hypothetical protein